MSRLINLLSRMLWQPGTCNDRVARRNRLTGEVQAFVLFERETEGVWIRFHKSEYYRFKVTK